MSNLVAPGSSILGNDISNYRFCENEYYLNAEVIHTLVGIPFYQKWRNEAAVASTGILDETAKH